MAEIKVTPESLRGEASKLKGLKQEHDNNINSFSQIIGGTAGQFTGAAADAYRNQFDSMKPTLTNFSNMLEGFAKLLETAANEMEGKDQSLASSMKSFG